MRSAARPVVVGVDGSGPASVAAAWAAHEAAVRHCPLHVVYGVDAPPGLATRTPPAVSARYAADDAVEAAVRRARTAVPGLAVRGDVRTGRPGALLAEASRYADLMVVGSHGEGWSGALPVGSTSRYLARHAVCPLVVLPPHAAGIGPVVVGTDCRPDSDAAVAFAFREAELRRVPLLAVHAWCTPRTHRTGHPPPARDAAGEDRLLAESLSRWSAGFPDVALRRRVVPRPPARALVDAVDGADLLVVGAGKAGLRGLLGTVGAQVLHDCPTAVALVRRHR